MKIIKIIKFPEYKRKAIVVEEYGSNVGYVVGFIHRNEELFKQALYDTKYIKYVDEEEENEKKD